MLLGIHLCGAKKIWFENSSKEMFEANILPQNTPSVLMPNLCGSYLQDHDVLTKADQDRLVWSSLTTLEGGLDTVSLEITFIVKLCDEITRRAYPPP